MTRFITIFKAFLVLLYKVFAFSALLKGFKNELQMNNHSCMTDGLNIKIVKRRVYAQHKANEILDKNRETNISPARKLNVIERKIQHSNENVHTCMPICCNFIEMRTGRGGVVMMPV